MAAQELNAPDIDRARIYRPMRELAAHLRQVTASVSTLVGGVTAGEVAADVDRTHTTIVVRGVENPPRLVD